MPTVTKCCSISNLFCMLILEVKIFFVGCYLKGDKKTIQAVKFRASS